MSITYINGGHYFKGYFDSVLKKVLQNNPGRGNIILSSVFGNNHPKSTGFFIFACGEPSNVKSSGRNAHVLIDCKDVASMRNKSTPFLYLPFYVTSFGERFKNTPYDLIQPKIPKNIAPKKTKFCAFLYSQQVTFRNRLYDTINKYKSVDALGKARSNKTVTDRHVIKPGVITYNDLAVQKYKPYKFVICCENSRHPGYVTEKIVSAMLANAVPIYLGAPDITKHFNPKSFINVADFSTYEAALIEIQKIDQDDKLYYEMLSQPWFYNGFNKYFDPNYCIPFIEENYKNYKKQNRVKTTTGTTITKFGRISRGRRRRYR